MNNFIGIDPGLSGAIAVIENGDLYVFDMPVLEYDISGKKKRKELNVGKLAGLLDVANCQAYLEGVAGMPGMGGTQMFAFGQSYGMTKAALALKGVPYEIISPQKWKNYFGLKKTRGMTTSEFKTLSRELAMQKFPARAERFKRKKDDGRAEAALIALYGLEQSGLQL